MNRQKLADLVSSSGLSDVNKQKLLKMIEQAPDIDKKFIKELRNHLGEIENSLAEKIANIQIQEAAKEFNAEMDDIQKDVKKLNAEISKKADEIDLKAARSKIE